MGSHRKTQVLPGLAAEGPPRGRPDPGHGRAGSGQRAAGHQQGSRCSDGEAVALGLSPTRRTAASRSTRIVLFVKEIFVDGGPTLKRIRPAPQGRAHRILKRQSHITIKLDTRPEGDGRLRRIPRPIRASRDTAFSSAAAVETGDISGPKDTSVRLSPGLQQELALSLVCRWAGLSQDPRRGSRSSQQPEEASSARWRERDRHRALTPTASGSRSTPRVPESSSAARVPRSTSCATT